MQNFKSKFYTEFKTFQNKKIKTKQKKTKCKTKMLQKRKPEEMDASGRIVKKEIARNIEQFFVSHSNK